MDRTGQVWSHSRRDIFMVLGPKTLSTRHSSDVWWYVLYLDGENSGLDDTLFEASDRPWEKRTGLRRIA